MLHRNLFHACKNNLNILKKLSPAPVFFPSSPHVSVHSMHRVLLCTMKDCRPDDEETVKSPWHNFVTTEFLKDMCKIFVEAEQSTDVHGIILAANRFGQAVHPKDFSLNDTAFCQGIDCQWLSTVKKADFEEFWFHWQELWVIMQLMKKPIIACIEGNAIGMGCALALACDLRLAAKTNNLWKIGFNEVRYGLIPPPWVTAALGYTIGYRPAEKLIQTGALVTPAHAHSIGLLDFLVESSPIEKSLVHMHRMLSVPQYGRHTAKSMIRRELLSTLMTDDDRKYDITYFQKYRGTHAYRDALKEYLAKVDEKTQLLPSESREDTWDPKSPESMGETVGNETKTK